nr:response regulator [Akkermansiaceae bacterium]
MPAAKDPIIDVAIVEDNAALGNGLRKIVESASDFRCVGVWTTAEDALKKIDAFRPQVVLMDINLPGMSGSEAT